MKIFLDDVRDPKECLGYMHSRIGANNPIYGQGGWYIVRSYDEFVAAIVTFWNKITHVSFDHDLADGHYDESMYESEEAYNLHLSSIKERTGYDCAVFLKNYAAKRQADLPTMFVHSMNPIGVQKIIRLFDHE